MITHEIFALINPQAGNTVGNIAVFDSYQQAYEFAKCCYGEKADAIDVNYIPCQPGDRYRDRQFWRIDMETGNEYAIMPRYTPEMEMQEVKATENLLMEVALDAQYQLAMLELSS